MVCGEDKATMRQDGFECGSVIDLGQKPRPVVAAMLWPEREGALGENAQADFDWATKAGFCSAALTLQVRDVGRCKDVSLAERSYGASTYVRSIMFLDTYASTQSLRCRRRLKAAGRRTSIE